MKSRRVALLTLAFGLMGAAPAAALDNLCDLDLDGQVTATDLQIMQGAWSGHGACPGDCDVTMDGAFSVADVEAVAKHLLGIEACPLTQQSAVTAVTALIGTKALVYVRDASGLNYYFVTKVVAAAPASLPHGRAVGLDVTGDDRPDTMASLPLAMKEPVPVSIPGQPPAVIIAFSHGEVLAWKRSMQSAKSPPRILVDLDEDGITDASLVTVGAWGW